jgi:hypothetical protein
VRSISPIGDAMKNKDHKGFDNIRKKIGCPLNDCGQFVTFTIAENFLNKMTQRTEVYSGNCNKCHRSFKLNGSNLVTFQSVYGQATIQVLEGTFEKLFDVDGEA